MHSNTTRSDFLRLRSQGQSFARIARQLGVSKPTLIAWSRLYRPELENQPDAKQELKNSAGHELAELNRKLDALKQELLSRALHDVDTATLETIAGELRKRIHALDPAADPAGGSPSPGAADGVSVKKKSDPGRGEGEQSTIEHPDPNSRSEGHDRGVESQSSTQYPESSIEEARTHPNLTEL